MASGRLGQVGGTVSGRLSGTDSWVVLPTNVIPCVFFPTLAPSCMVHAPDLPPTSAPGSTPRLPESRHWGSALRANPPIFVPSADATMQAPASHRAIAQHRLRTGTSHDCPWNQTPPSPPNVLALRPTVSTTDPLFLQVLPQVQPASSFFYNLLSDTISSDTDGRLVTRAPGLALLS